MPFKNEMGTEGLIANIVQYSNLDPKQGRQAIIPDSAQSNQDSTSMPPSRCRTAPQMLDNLPS